MRGWQNAPAFVLFDDAQATEAQPSSRLFTAPAAHWAARTDAEVHAAFDRVEAATRAGQCVALFVGYAAARALADLPVVDQPQPGDEWPPLVEALAFAHGCCMSADAVTGWLEAECAALAEGEGSAPAGVAALMPTLDESIYANALERIAAHQRAGETYQINFTWPLEGRAYGHPLVLYTALRRRQPTRYAALARLADRWVLSLSPELFFARDGQRLCARPMKGTAPRRPDAEADARTARELAVDPKNRAENLMILDLLRNDLGRLAVPGSVEVPERFTVEPYPTVWQMTSTVQATLPDPSPDWAAIFRALFPCGSVTGAPKRSSMSIIRKLEGRPRGLYTGTIGFIDPVARKAAFNVPIRTLELAGEPAERGPEAGTRSLRVGVGSGVVIDSDIQAEWLECWDKLRFLTGHDPGFGLIETFAAVWPAQTWRIEHHLRRLEASARYFGFAWDRDRLVEAIAGAHAALPQPASGTQASQGWQAAVDSLAPAAHRTRIVLHKDGRLDLDVQPMLPVPEQPVGLLLAAQRLEAADLFLRHKTTHRAMYDAAWRAAQEQGAFDQIFLNQHGELCEGGRSTLLLRLGGRWCTPALGSGLLPGVARRILLEAGACEECVLTLDDLQAAEAVAVANSMRGVLAARFEAAV